MINYVGDKLKELLNKKQRSIAELGVKINLHPGRLSQLINGKTRLSVDMAIRLGKAFPYPWTPCAEVPASNSTVKYWLELQHKADCENATELDGPMYRNIQPF